MDVENEDCRAGGLKGQCFPPGASTPEALEQWPEEVVEDCLADGDQDEHFAHLQDAFEKGIAIETDFSGGAGAEMSVLMILYKFQAMFGPAAKFCFWRASDILPSCRAVLMQGSWTTGPRHVSGDFDNRLLAAVREKCQALYFRACSACDEMVKQGSSWKTAVASVGEQFSASLLDQLDAVNFAADATCWCYKCASYCRLHMPADFADYLRCAIAGTVCQPFSAIGKKKKQLARSTVSAFIWAYDLLSWLPHFAIHECTAAFPVKWFKQILGYFYLVFTEVWCITETAWPGRRRRRYSPWMLKDQFVCLDRIGAFSIRGTRALRHGRVDERHRLRECSGARL